MATTILRNHDRPNLPYMSLSTPPIYPRHNPRRRKRSPTDLHGGGFKAPMRDVDRSMVVKFPAKDLVMGKVTILKRGEDLKVGEDVKFENRLGDLVTDRKVRFEREDDSFLCSTEDEIVQKQFSVIDLSYSSPEPSMLPLPFFLERSPRYM